ncbi:putative vitellogenin receptor [Oppia nitens]|uniref:putative vitellogenin receptor n=1 Tax=Oppia nitens TaxID=1686743 RepID=UPI0023DA2A10|nr:putative vitellogenin receptor [Oppia nitens]
MRLFKLVDTHHHQHHHHQHHHQNRVNHLHTIFYEQLRHTGLALDYSIFGNFIVWLMFDKSNVSLYTKILDPSLANNVGQESTRTVLSMTYDCMTYDRDIALAVDWIHYLLYIPVCNETNRNFGLMAVRLLAPVAMVQIYNSDKPVPRISDIRVDPQVSLVFWTEFSYNSIQMTPRVMRSTQDGHHIRVIAEDRDAIAKSLTLDIHNRRVCWLTSYRESRQLSVAMLVCVGYDGTGKQVYTHLNSYFKNINPNINILNGNIYWISDLGKSISMIPISSSNEHFPSIIMDSNYNIGINQFRIVDRSLQSLGKDHCTDHNCSHMCVPTPDNTMGYRCMCPTGRVVWNGSQCLDKIELTNKIIMFNYTTNMITNKSSHLWHNYNKHIILLSLLSVLIQLSLHDITV